MLNLARQIGRFGLVGLGATLLHVGVALLTHSLLALSPQVANLIGFLCGFTFSYVGHFAFTFDAKGPHGLHMPRFFAVALVGYGLSATITYVTTSTYGGSMALAMALVIVTVPLATFIAARLWAFNHAASGLSVAVGDHLIAAVGIAAYTAVYVAVFSQFQSHHDTAWYLVATAEWLSGKELYRDIVEINPPLAFYLTAPAIWLSDLFSLSRTAGLVLYTGLLSALSLCWCWRLMSRMSTLPWRRRFAWVGVCALAAVVPAAADIGQREHLLVIFLLPYLTALSLQAAGERIGPSTETGVAAYALLGLALKPYFLAIPLAVTLVTMLRDRNFHALLSTGNIVIAFGCVTYLALVWLLHPAYLHEIVPLGRDIYGAYGFGADHLVRAARPVVAVAAIIVTGIAALKRARLQGGWVLLAALGGAYLAYFAQGAGFYYHTVPIAAMGLLAFGWLAVASHGSGILRLAAVLAMAPIFAAAVLVGPYRNPEANALLKLITADPGERSVAALSTNLPPAFPMVLDAHARWIGRYPTLWLLPGALNRLDRDDCDFAGSCERPRAILDIARETTVADLIKGKPRYILVDRFPLFVRQRDFDFVAFFRQDPAFDALWSSYSKIATVGTVELWRRSSDP